MSAPLLRLLRLDDECHYLVLYCTVLYCTVLYCTVLYCRWSSLSPSISPSPTLTRNYLPFPSFHYPYTNTYLLSAAPHPQPSSSITARGTSWPSSPLLSNTGSSHSSSPLSNPLSPLSPSSHSRLLSQARLCAPPLCSPRALHLPTWSRLRSVKNTHSSRTECTPSAATPHT